MMAFQVISSLVKVAKIILGIPEEPNWKARSWYITAYPTIPKAIEWSKVAQENRNHQLNAHLIAARDEFERQSTRESGQSTSGTERPQALLKGSPKALGWEVDEEEENAAWCLLMADAMETTVFEKPTVADAKEALRIEAAAASQKESYRSYLEQWDEQRTKLVWKVNVSLCGNHAWTLVPRDKSGSPGGNSEVAFDSNGALSVVPVVERQLGDLSSAHSSCSHIAGTKKRSFSDASVQAPVDGHTPIGAQEPLSEIPPLLEVELDISRPPTPSVSSIASKASKIPRLATLRRESVASLFETASKQAAASQSPSAPEPTPPVASSSSPVVAPIPIAPAALTVPMKDPEQKPTSGRARAPSFAKRSSSPAPSMRSVTARLLHRRQSAHSIKTEASLQSKLATSPSKEPAHLPHASSPPKLKRRTTERVRSAVKAMGGSYEAAEIFKGFM